VLGKKAHGPVAREPVVARRWARTSKRAKEAQKTREGELGMSHPLGLTTFMRPDTADTCMCTWRAGRGARRGES